MKIKIEVTAENANELPGLQQGLDEVLRVVASNPEASSQILDAMSVVTNPVVRMEAAANPTSTMDTLDRLIDDADPEVRAAIVRHPDAIHYVWKLISDPSPLVRYCVAMHNGFPEHVYQALSRDENPRVVRRAKKTLSELKSHESLVVRLMDRMTNNNKVAS